MTFNLNEAAKKFDMEEIVFSLDMEDVFNVIADRFTEAEQEKICTELSAALIQHRIQIDWVEELEALLRFRLSSV